MVPDSGLIEQMLAELKRPTTDLVASANVLAGLLSAPPPDYKSDLNEDLFALIAETRFGQLLQSMNALSKRLYVIPLGWAYKCKGNVFCPLFLAFVQ